MPVTNNKYNIAISNNKKVFFVSDHHFGLVGSESSLVREKHFVKWLDAVKTQAEAIFILGDMFDYWYEYKRAIPKGFVRVLGKLAALSDAGIPIYFFVGNHDMWMRDYLQKELGITVFFKPEIFTINKQSFLIGHGDGLGPGDKSYKQLKKLFSNKIAQWAFRWVHPDIGLKLVKYLSQKNKLLSGEYDSVFHGEANEWLYLYAKQYNRTQQYINFFVFGHRHLPLAMKLDETSTYYNTGDWLKYYSYLEFDGTTMMQKTYAL